MRPILRRSPLLLLSLLPHAASAGDTAPTYSLMAPFGSLLSGSVDLTTYLQGIVQVAIGAAGILAVVMIVVCGIKLMGTPSASGKSEAKECIWNAIFGVLLALGAWILLYTINPYLLSKELNLTNVQPAPPATAAPTGAPATTGCGPGAEQPMPTTPGWYFKFCTSTTAAAYNPGGTSGQTCAQLAQAAVTAGKIVIKVNGQTCFQVQPPGATTPATGDGTEVGVRTTLCGNASCVGSTPLGINTGPCPSVGSRGCTNVNGLGGVAIAHLQALPSACGCNVVISGGTEYWLHSQAGSSSHAPGNDVFDLRKPSPLDSFIKTNATKQAKSFKNYQRYLYNGFWYTDEGNHWHACKENTDASYCKTPP